MKKIIYICVLLLLILAGCGEEGESEDGDFIDVRERSTTLHDIEINDDYLPDEEIIKNKSGATEGTPAKLGDTVIFKGYLGEELGVSVFNFKRGTSAYNIIKEELSFLEEPPKNMEYVLVESNFYSYDSKEEPYFVTALDFELRNGTNEEVYEAEHLYNKEGNIKNYLKTGEKTKDGAVFLVSKADKELYALYNLEATEDSLWFSLK